MTVCNLQAIGVVSIPICSYGKTGFSFIHKQELFVKLESCVQKRMRTQIFYTGKAAGLELKYKCNA